MCENHVMVSLVILHISKWNRKQKMFKIVGFFLDFFSWFILTTRSRNTASMNPIQMGLYFSKMLVEFPFLDLQDSPTSQSLVQIENVTPSSSKAALFLRFRLKMTLFCVLTHGMGHSEHFSDGTK